MDTPEINQPDPQNEPNQQNQSNQSNPGFPSGNRNRRRRRRGRKGGGQQNARAQSGRRQSQGQGQFTNRRGDQQNRRGGQAGGRRRGGGGRGPAAFVGPMDHSYRNANGGGNVGGMVNGRYRSPGYQESELQAIPPSDDASTRVVCFVDDLFFLAKIQEVARKIGVKVEFAKAEKETIDRIISDEDKPSLIIFDLNNANAKPLVTIPKLKSKLKKGTSIVGFLSHLQGDLKLKAQEAGCDMVVPKSAFSQNLPSLLRRHATSGESDRSEES